MKTLEEQIKDLKINYLNSDITSKNFPVEKVRSELVVKHYNKFVTSEEVIAEMQKERLEPANLYELLSYAKDGWNDKDFVVALGSVFVDSYGYRLVPFLGRWDAERGLFLHYWGGGWPPYYRFLAAREPLDTRSLSSPELGDLELPDKLTINGARYKKV